MPEVSQTTDNRQQPTSMKDDPSADAADAAQTSEHTPIRLGDVADRARDWLGKVRIALGGRDLSAEIAGYALALKGASADQTAHIVDALLEMVETRSAADALALVAGVWLRLEPRHRAQVVAAGHGIWPEACTIAMIDPDPNGRMSVATLVGVLCEPRCARVLRELLADRDPLVAEAAGSAVMAIAERTTREPALDPAGLAGVRETVAEAVLAFDRNRRRESLGAMLLLCATSVGLRGCKTYIRALLDDVDHPAHMVLRGIMRRGDALATREAAWTCMSIEPWRTACVDRLGLSTDGEGMARVLRRGYLLANPVRAAALVRVREGVRRGRCPGLDIDSHTLECLQTDAAAHAPRWLACVHEGSAGGGLGQRLEVLLAHESARVRLAALLAMSAEKGWTTGAGADFVFDAEARIARSAVVRLVVPSARATIEPKRLRGTMESLTRSPHGAVRAMARTLGEGLDPLSDSGPSRLAARRMLQADPEAFAAELQTAVRNGPLERRLRAIATARRLGLGARIELELLTLVHRSAERATWAGALSEERREAMHSAAAAVTLLAELHSPAAQHAVHRCLRHADARVRANALDAMARMSRRSGVIAGGEGLLAAAIVEFKNDPHHRVRAGAARAGILAAIAGGNDGAQDGTGSRGVESASLSVLAMLNDERPMHRVSGLWLAERVAGMSVGATAACQTLASAVAEVVRSEPDIQVRSRARLAGERLMAQIRTGWSAPAQSPSGR